jgi:serine/threonine protein kinase
VHGWGRTQAKQLYLVLEYLSGQPLEDRLAADAQRGTPLDPRAALKILRELAGALATMHAAGMFHGDIKPDNVILDVALDRAVLIDFGLGLGGDFRGGTPGFSAPEQFATDTPLEPNPSLDVYGLAALAYVMLTGRQPFDNVHGLSRVAYQMISDLAPASHVRPGLPEALDAVLARGMSVDPTQRHDSVLAFAHAVEEVLGPRSRSIPTPSPMEESLPASRGGGFRLARAEVTLRLGREEEAKILASVSDLERAIVESVIDDEAWYSAAAFVAYLDAYASGDLQKVEALAVAVTTAVLPTVLRTIPVARTPSTMLHVASPLLYRFHNWGKLAITQTTPEHASITLRMPKELAPVMCRYVRGSLLALLRFAAAKPKISEEWCLAHGAGACEMKIRW